MILIVFIVLALALLAVQIDDLPNFRDLDGLLYGLADMIDDMLYEIRNKFD